MIEYYYSRIDLEKCVHNSINDIDQNIFREGVHTNLDKIQSSFDNDNDILTEIKDTLTKMIVASPTFVDKAKKGQNKTKFGNVIHQKHNEKYKHHLLLSPTNAKILSQILENAPQNFHLKIGKYKIKNTDIEFEPLSKTAMRIKIDCITSSSMSMVSIGHELQTKVKNTYITF